MADFQADIAATTRAAREGNAELKPDDDPSPGRPGDAIDPVQSALEPWRGGLLHRIELRLGSIT